MCEGGIRPSILTVLWPLEKALEGKARPPPTFNRSEPPPVLCEPPGESEPVEEGQEGVQRRKGIFRVLLNPGSPGF